MILESGAHPRGDNDSRPPGDGSWRDNRRQEPCKERDRAPEPQREWRHGTSNTEQRGGGGSYGFRDRDRDDQRRQYPSRSSGEQYPSRQSDERERERERDMAYSGQQSRDAYWRQGGGRSGEQQRERDSRSEQQGAPRVWRPGRYNEQQQRQQPPMGCARDVPERLGPRPSRQLVGDDEALATGAAKEKKGTGAPDVSNRFGLLDEDEDAAPAGEEEEPVSTSIGAERSTSRQIDYNYD